jgi:hypothetical protein
VDTLVLSMQRDDVPARRMALACVWERSALIPRFSAARRQLRIARREVSDSEPNNGPTVASVRSIAIWASGTGRAPQPRLLVVVGFPVSEATGGAWERHAIAPLVAHDASCTSATEMRNPRARRRIAADLRLTRLKKGSVSGVWRVLRVMTTKLTS